MEEPPAEIDEPRQAGREVAKETQSSAGDTVILDAHVPAKWRFRGGGWTCGSGLFDIRGQKEEGADEKPEGSLIRSWESQVTAMTWRPRHQRWRRCEEA